MQKPMQSYLKTRDKLNKIYVLDSLWKSLQILFDNLILNLINLASLL